MIWVDFGIICIGQKNSSVPSDVADKLIVDIHDRQGDSSPLYDKTYYNFCTADKLNGYWYNFFLPDPACFEESLFDISHRDIPYITILPKWVDTVRRILEFYINESPDNRIAVLIRIQDNSDDVEHSVRSIDEFMGELIDGNIRWNELYYIQKQIHSFGR